MCYSHLHKHVTSLARTPLIHVHTSPFHALTVLSFLRNNQSRQLHAISFDVELLDIAISQFPGHLRFEIYQRNVSIQLLKNFTTFQMSINNPINSGSSLPKTVLVSPSQNEIQATDLSNMPSSSSINLNKLRFEFTVDHGNALVNSDVQTKRLKLLRKELDHIQNTAWQLQPIEKYIGP
ncbi:unnamed protein product [Timema podura]|uniref:Uncharacterized protein n=1 Tax=Timema podura TaxID=61482 RepID=A0ABN7NUH8_TIMPD|nr:unnamed protein product [Timema podura]